MPFCLVLWCHRKTVWRVYHHHVRLIHSSQIQCIVCPIDNFFPSSIKIYLLHYSNPCFTNQSCCILACKLCNQDISRQFPSAIHIGCSSIWPWMGTSVEDWLHHAHHSLQSNIPRDAMQMSVQMYIMRSWKCVGSSDSLNNCTSWGLGNVQAVVTWIFLTNGASQSN